MINEEIFHIKKLIYELSPSSSGVEEFLSVIKHNPEIVNQLGFEDFKSLNNFILDASYSEFQQLKKDVETINKEKDTTFNEEMDEFERTVQYLNREEGIDISVSELLDAFKNSKEITITDSIWNSLENTESNKIKKGEINKVIDIAKKYNKSNPLKLKKDLLSGKYKRPLILSFNGRYYLVAGNTRLSTAAAVGIKPKVFLAKI